MSYLNFKVLQYKSIILALFVNVSFFYSPVLNWAETDDEYLISGIVIEENGPCIGAKIELENSDIVSETNWDGEFSMAVSSHQLKNETLKLFVSHPGFKSHELHLESQKLKQSKYPRIVINLIDDLKGAVYLPQPRLSKSQRNWIKFKKVFKKRKSGNSN